MNRVVERVGLSLVAVANVGFSVHGILEGQGGMAFLNALAAGVCISMLLTTRNKK